MLLLLYVLDMQQFSLMFLFSFLYVVFDLQHVFLVFVFLLLKEDTVYCIQYTFQDKIQATGVNMSCFISVHSIIALFFKFVDGEMV